MANNITGKYFTRSDFLQRGQEVLSEVIAQTGFIVEKEIFRCLGLVYNPKKGGSL